MHRDASGFVAGNSLRVFVRFLSFRDFFCTRREDVPCGDSSNYVERDSTYGSGPDARLALRDKLAEGRAVAACLARRFVRCPLRAGDVFVIGHRDPRKRPSQCVLTVLRAQFGRTNLSSVLP